MAYFASEEQYSDKIINSTQFVFFFFLNFQNCYHLFRCFKLIGIKYTILIMDIRLAVIFARCVFRKSDTNFEREQN